MTAAATGGSAKGEGKGDGGSQGGGQPPHPPQPPPQPVRTSQGGQAVTLSALSAEAVQGAALRPYLERMRAVLISEEPNCMDRLKEIMSGLADTQIALISAHDIFGSAHASNIAYNLGSEIEVMNGSMAPTGSTLASRLTRASVYAPVPIAAYATVLMDIEKFMAFLSPNLSGDLSVKSLSVLLAHSAFRMSYGEGQLSSLRGAGYVIPHKGGIAKVVGVTETMGGPMYLPQALGGVKHQSLRSNLVTFTVQHTETEKPDVQNKLCPLAVTDATNPVHMMKEVRLCLSHLYTNSGATGINRPRRLIYSLLHAMCENFGKDIPEPHLNIYEPEIDVTAVMPSSSVFELASGKMPRGVTLKRKRE